MYFQRIWEELHEQRFVERGEGEGMAMEGSLNTKPSSLSGQPARSKRMRGSPGVAWRCSMDAVCSTW